MNFLSFIDKFIPEAIRKDPAEYSRAKNIVGCSFILLPAGAGFSLLFVIFHLYAGIALVVGTTIIYTCLPFLVRSGKSLNAVGGLAIFMLWVLFFSLTYIQGGLPAPCVTWFPLVPVMASFLNGVRSGIKWVVFTALSVVALQVMHMSGFKFPTVGFSPSDIIILLGLGISNSVIATGLITVASESMKRKGFEDMLKSQKETEEALKQQEYMAGKLEEDKLKLRESEERLSAQKKFLSDSIDLMLNEMRSFSEGDLTVCLKKERDDEIGKLFEGFNSSVIRFNELVTHIQQAVLAAASTSAQLSSSSEEMAAGAHEQSMQTTEVVNAVGEMTRNIQKNSKYAAQAADRSKLASERARDGAGKVRLTKQGMEKIANSAKETARVISSLAVKTDQIGEIVQVIDDIADQTNLLALNAAIEAARAGEQGRGFAVVADEVRKLAERTTKATKEIAQTIKSIQTEAKEADSSMNKAEGAVAEGMLLTEEVSGAFSQIIEVNENVLGLVTQLADGSSEQTEAAEMISRNIEAIATVTGQSAAGIGQIAHASEDLNRLTLDLQDLISTFRIGEEGRAAKKAERVTKEVKVIGKAVLSNKNQEIASR